MLFDVGGLFANRRAYKTEIAVRKHRAFRRAGSSGCVDYNRRIFEIDLLHRSRNQSLIRSDRIATDLQEVFEALQFQFGYICDVFLLLDQKNILQMLKLRSNLAHFFKTLDRIDYKKLRFAMVENISDPRRHC